MNEKSLTPPLQSKSGPLRRQRKTYHTSTSGTPSYQNRTRSFAIPPSNRSTNVVARPMTSHHISNGKKLTVDQLTIYRAEGGDREEEKGLQAASPLGSTSYPNWCLLGR